ncbi:hypothetical protein [Capnocytophaga sp. oral taxon 903]|jgi:hypothetical protein|uniref:hypothetical protein n=1 Tax=Capnocytophaga sp. oral taxon 903 TaxID=2748317 RepID=UPI0015B987CF|nr:hypothetical protein [Capnocytophaga sp. oral taxon 903]NWO30057.1 hypothetical protein [Capnocytophaga sp. oral taxon 903]
MRKMFTLRGASSCGKSSKIKAIAEWIRDNYNLEVSGINFDDSDILGVLQVGKLKIGFVSAGDSEECVKGADEILQQYPDIDIIINCCRTKEKSYKYINSTYNYANGWIGKYIDVERYEANEKIKQQQRDNKIIEEIKSWLFGIEKL